MKALLAAAALIGVSTFAMAEQGDAQDQALMQQQQAQMPQDNSGYGGTPAGSAQSGGPAHTTPKTGISSFDDIYHGS